VVDDGSTDRTRELLLSHGDRLRYLYQENSGSCSKPRNAGVKIASGELIAFIDADDIMAPVRIAREVAFLTAHPDVGIVFTNYRDF
jgi:glycosyltransferase involved in cell wall biosynthesis